MTPRAGRDSRERAAHARRDVFDLRLRLRGDEKTGMPGAGEDPARSAVVVVGVRRHANCPAEWFLRVG